MNSAVQPQSASDFRQAIEVLLAAGDRGEAMVHASRYWRGTPTPSTAKYIVSLLDRLWEPGQVARHKVAFIRSFTLEPAIALLEANAALDGCRIETWIGGFNTFAQEAFDPASKLYEFGADTVFVAVHARDLFPLLWHDFPVAAADAVREEIDSGIAMLSSILGTLRQRTQANIVVQGMDRPCHPAAGLFDAQQWPGQFDLFADVNRRLRDYCRSLSGVYWCDGDDLAGRHGRLGWSDEKKWVTVRMPYSVAALPPLADEWWRFLAPLALKPAKVLVLDLDNTLWGGVVGEDGIGGLALSDDLPGGHFKAFQRNVRDISRRGILLAICSKNNEADALKVFAEHPHMVLRTDDFSAMRINWLPKPENIASIAAELNVGIDSLVFIDDSPVERAAVRQALPEVRVIDLPEDPARYADSLRKAGYFERLHLGKEDLERKTYYKQERERREAEKGAGDIENYLRYLNISVTTAPVDGGSLARSAQLTQKTNQLNFTTRRYTEAQVAEMLARPGWFGFTLQSGDRFGDNGIVGLTLVDGRTAAWEIDTFLMSCRVIGRTIETAFLGILCEKARAAGATSLGGWFIPTAKNTPAAKIYADHAFAPTAEKDGATYWRLDLTAGTVTVPEWIKLA